MRAKTKSITWQEHSVNAVEDYKKIFGEHPPKKIRIAIMSDSDNTKESARAYVDYLEIVD